MFFDLIVLGQVTLDSYSTIEIVTVVSSVHFQNFLHTVNG
jgi:hypothetical protein